MTLDEAFTYFVNIVVRLPDEFIDNHIKSFPGNTLLLGEPSRPISMDEFYVMHLENLDNEMGRLNTDLCTHWGHCEGNFVPLPHENDSGGRGPAPLLLPTRALVVVALFIGVSLAGFLGRLAPWAP